MAFALWEEKKVEYQINPPGCLFKTLARLSPTVLGGGSFALYMRSSSSTLTTLEKIPIFRRPAAHHPQVCDSSRRDLCDAGLSRSPSGMGCCSSPQLARLLGPAVVYVLGIFVWLAILRIEPAFSLNSPVLVSMGARKKCACYTDQTFLAPEPLRLHSSADLRSSGGDTR